MKGINFFIAFLFVFLIVSCNTELKNDYEREPKPDSNFNSNTSKVSVEKFKNEVSSFREFLMKFASALRENDTSALDEYLENPVIFKGKEDSDPVYKLTKTKRIDKILEIYTKKGFYDDIKDLSVSYIDFFNDSNALMNECNDDNIYQDIKDFSFKRNNDNVWKLIMVYSNDK